MLIEQVQIMGKPVRFYRCDDGRGIILNGHDAEQATGSPVTLGEYTDLAELFNVLVSRAPKDELDKALDYFQDYDFDSLNSVVWKVDWNREHMRGH